MHSKIASLKLFFIFSMLCLAKTVQAEPIMINCPAATKEGTYITAKPTPSKNGYIYSGNLIGPIPANERVVSGTKDDTEVKHFELFNVTLSPEKEVSCTYRTTGGQKLCDLLTLTGSLADLKLTCKVPEGQKYIECMSPAS